MTLRLYSIAFILIIVAFPLETTQAQGNQSPEKKIAKLEAKIKSMSDKIKTLEARISSLEVLRAFPSTEQMRHGMIQSNKDALINDLNNLAANAYQYRIRPTTMGGGGGSYAGYKIPQRLSSNDNGQFEAIVSNDSTVTFIATSSLKLGTVKALLIKEGRLGMFEYTGEFQ